MKKLLLTMIVRNESRVIERCLNAARDVIDGVVICDTGSSDDTVERIQAWIVEQQASCPDFVGQVYHHTWQNFGQNRTLSARAATELIEHLGWDRSNTYLLLLDADLLLKRVSGVTFDAGTLTAPAYHLRWDLHGRLSFYLTALLRADFAWRSVGVTHEYWASTPPCQPTRLESLYIEDLGDGGSRANKAQRDIDLLEQGLRDEPTNSRYMFYLANTYFDTGRWQEAEEWYQKRIEAGGWAEEVWYAHLRKGQAQLNQGNKLAVSSLLEAYSLRPWRAEPLYALAASYSKTETHILAFQFAKLAAAIPFPTQDLLFVDTPVYQYAANDLLAIHAYYVNEREIGEEAARKCVRYNPGNVRFQRNLEFYLKSL